MPKNTQTTNSVSVENRKSGKRTAKRTVAKASNRGKSPDAKAPDAKAAEKREAKKHDIKLTYAGPSPTVRGHERKLSAIRTDIGAANVTVRDGTFIADIVAKYGTKPFKRYDTDAGCVRRAIAHGFLQHVSGPADARDATFQATDTGEQYATAVSKAS